MFNVHAHSVRLVVVRKAEKTVDDRANMTDGIVFPARPPFWPRGPSSTNQPLSFLSNIRCARPRQLETLIMSCCCFFFICFIRQVDGKQSNYYSPKLTRFLNQSPTASHSRWRTSGCPFRGHGSSACLRIHEACLNVNFNLKPICSRLKDKINFTTLLYHTVYHLCPWG